jgi:hypothetical protein
MLDHPHVLKLHGAVVDEDNICIVTELVPGGMCLSVYVCIYESYAWNRVARISCLEVCLHVYSCAWIRMYLLGARQDMYGDGNFIRRYVYLCVNVCPSCNAAIEPKAVIYVCAYIYIYIYVCIYIYAYIYIHIYVCIVHTHTYLYTHTHTYTFWAQDPYLISSIRSHNSSPKLSLS